MNIANSIALNPFQKAILLDKSDKKLSKGCIAIKVQEKRTQFKNRELAIKKLITLLKDKLISNSKTSKPTKHLKLEELNQRKKEAS